jgi:hypothetical protein
MKGCHPTKIFIASCNPPPAKLNVVKLAGYSFTDAEFEDYTAQLLGTETQGDRLESLNERDLAGVLGGASIFMQGFVQVPPYGQSPDLYNQY